VPIARLKKDTLFINSCCRLGKPADDSLLLIFDSWCLLAGRIVSIRAGANGVMANLRQGKKKKQISTALGKAQQ
jgi:hypothetical protein